MQALGGSTHSLLFGQISGGSEDHDDRVVFELHGPGHNKSVSCSTMDCASQACDRVEGHKAEWESARPRRKLVASRRGFIFPELLARCQRGPAGFTYAAECKSAIFSWRCY